MSETITFLEFKQWLTDMIISNNGAIPNREDWIQIKMMMDKVSTDAPQSSNVPANDPVIYSLEEMEESAKLYEELCLMVDDNNG